MAANVCPAHASGWKMSSACKQPTGTGSDSTAHGLPPPRRHRPAATVLPSPPLATAATAASCCQLCTAIQGSAMPSCRHPRRPWHDWQSPQQVCSPTKGAFSLQAARQALLPAQGCELLGFQLLLKLLGVEFSEAGNHHPGWMRGCCAIALSGDGWACRR